MYDLVINNGLIVDGSGDKGFLGSIGIKGDKICSISQDELTGMKIIDAKGLVVAPGFIDVHSHSDASFILENNDLDSKVFQGITSEIIGNCGVSIVPTPRLDNYYEAFKMYSSGLIDGISESHKVESIVDYKEMFLKKKNPINCGVLIGHGNLRICAMGFDNRRATVEEVDYMKELLDFELSNGALGMSLGLIYPPGSFSDTDELIELSKVLKNHDAILTAHIRNENEGVFEAAKEIIDIAKASGVRAHISHLKLMGKSNWGKSNELIELIKEANKNGITLTFDQYPYNSSSTTLTTLLPTRLFEGGTIKMLDRLNKYGDEIEGEINKNISKRGGPERIKISDTHGKKIDCEGKTIYELSKTIKLSYGRTVMKLINDTQGDINAIYTSMSEEDVKNILGQSNGIVGSDGVGLELSKKRHLHPRNFSTFPRFFKISREIGLEKEIAVEKATGLAAKYFKLEGVGTLVEGNYADIVIFDWGNFEDDNTFENHKANPKGLHYVIVSGKILLEEGRLTNNRYGRLL